MADSTQHAHENAHESESSDSPRTTRTSSPRMDREKPVKPVVASRWVLIDASGLVVGRLAAEIAKLLRGKHNPNFAPHRDSGDHVVVVNTDKMHFTGKKRETKVYYRHTGYPGGIKSKSAKTLFQNNGSKEVLRYAVKGMIPRGVLGRQQMGKLKLFCGAEHLHEAQKPELLDIARQNPKNTDRLAQQ